MTRQTRSGNYFSPWELTDIHEPTAARSFEVIQTSISLDALMQQSIFDSDIHAAHLDGVAVEPGDEEWEDEGEVFSEAPSPLTPSPADSPASSTASSRSSSPEPIASSSGSAPLPISSRAPTPASGQPTSSGIERRRHNQQSSKRRKERRKELHQGRTPYDRGLDPRYPQTHREETPHKAGFNLVGAPVSTGGSWVGRRSKKATFRTLQLPELYDSGAKLVEWDGINPRLITDNQGRIVAILLGAPEDPDWVKVIERAAKAMQRARRLAHQRGAWCPGVAHRRGCYLLLTSGVSFGGGQKRPGNLRNTKFFRRLIRRLLNSKDIRRIAGFQSSGLALYAPKLYKHYCTVLRALFEHQPELVHNFDNSVFPVMSFNCGDAVTFEHCDFLNVAHGLCPVTSGGKFDHKKGGHLYLKQLQLLIEFPSGATALIPSACIDHGNTPIQPGETRYSITQFAAGGLFRWVAYGFQTAKSLLAQAEGQALKDAFDGMPGSRWKWALDLFSKVDELEADRAAAFGR
ncbi:hypothetical protein MVEN_01973100 [Mycena venus]|uniref:Uncharacterized protein n=1 Tax=Mycena venus TaxID=2733690 RepID=A0A8H6XDZ2_9AGAR|nr:hypothetical protein MVEN_01973100 [Mycena venus]